jgi:2-C-methyl-D-erythritol 4-phosphate cytidylyltransferase
VPTSDTILTVANGVIAHVPPRETLYRAQTPQCFRLATIAKAHALAAADPAFQPTDDCGVVLRYLPDTPVHIVPGSEINLKVTYPSDLAIAEALLRQTADLPEHRPATTDFRSRAGRALSRRGYQVPGVPRAELVFHCLEGAAARFRCIPDDEEQRAHERGGQ